MKVLIDTGGVTGSVEYLDDGGARATLAGVGWSFEATVDLRGAAEFHRELTTFLLGFDIMRARAAAPHSPGRAKG